MKFFQKCRRAAWRGRKPTSCGRGTFPNPNHNPNPNPNPTSPRLLPVPLERFGGNGIVNRHWPVSLVPDELMSMDLSGRDGFGLPLPRVTTLTIAALNDTGWYTVPSYTGVYGSLLLANGNQVIPSHYLSTSSSHTNYIYAITQPPPTYLPT